MVRAVRGATTVEVNTREAIIGATAELLVRLTEENGIDKDDIISVIFTATKDLDAEYPAVAARQLGWTDIGLICVNEMEVKGSLKKCIRVLLQFNSDKKNSDLKYVYLKEAKKLRPDLFQQQQQAN
jgi:chorismate mutase